MSAAEDDTNGVPEWVVTYGDMMSLLLTFFIMLVSMSELKDEGKNRAMMDAIRKRFGPSAGTSGLLGRTLQENSAMTELHSQGNRSEGGVKKASRKSPGQAGAHLTVRRINHGTVVTMGGPTMFKPFDATLSAKLKKNLDVIAQVVKPKPNRLVIRGHASAEPVPRDSQFDDPLHLSFERAHNVVQYLIGKGIDKRRLLVSAAGDTEPRILTREKAIQMRNRRVDVFLIDSYISRSPPPDAKP